MPLNKETKPNLYYTQDFLSQVDLLVDWFVGFYGISLFVGYLTPNPFLRK